MALVAVAAAGVQAQQFPFELRVSQGDRVSTVPNNSSLSLNTAVGRTLTVRVTATYTGTGQVTVSQQPNVFGSTFFRAVIPSAPVALNPGENVVLTLEFTPANPAPASAQVVLRFVEAIPSASGPPTNVPNSISLLLNGTAPSLILTYVLQTDLNVVPIPPGGTIVVPPTLVNTTAQVALNVTNTGSGAGGVTGMSITGEAFRLSGLPLFPLVVGSGQSLQVLIRYQPVRVGVDTGQVQITFEGSPTAIVNLEGTGSAPNLVYEILETNPPTPVLPGSTLTLPETNVGETSSLVLRIRNAGTAPGAVNTIASVGPAFPLSNVPVLPRVLPPEASVTFTLNFAPLQPGVLSGSLVINGDILSLRGTGLAPRLEFSYISGGNTILLTAANNAVLFSPVPVTQSGDVRVSVRNTGTLTAVISNIGVSQGANVFSVTQGPALPVSLAPGTGIDFPLTFRPLVPGVISGTLQVNTTAIPLVGTGNAPPPLPDYAFTGVAATVPARSQPGIGLTLASPYPVALAGILALTVSGNLPADPAVQFATGGRTVAFVIPANSTSAVFAGQGTQIGLQSGTVASTITLTPTFAIQAGGFDLTPNPPRTQQFVVATAPPTLVALLLNNQTANSFVLSAVGFTTTRSLTTATVQFETAPGFSMPSSRLSIDIRQTAAVWFQSVASQGFGGQFALSIPITLEGTVAAGQSLIRSLTSVSVTLDNEMGSSNSVRAAFQ